jgi:hypothetical protein
MQPLTFVLNFELLLDAARVLTSQEEEGGGAADETHRVEAATSPPSVGSLPQTRVHWEVAQGEEQAAKEAGQSVAGKATTVEEVRAPPASPVEPPPEHPGRELFPVGQDPVLPGAGRAEQQEAG